MINILFLVFVDQSLVASGPRLWDIKDASKMFPRRESLLCWLAPVANGNVNKSIFRFFSLSKIETLRYPRRIDGLQRQTLFFCRWVEAGRSDDVWPINNCSVGGLPQPMPGFGGRYFNLLKIF
jgi:hypothetical protein